MGVCGASHCLPTRREERLQQMTDPPPASPGTVDDRRSAVHDAVEVLQQGFLETNDLEVREDETIAAESLGFEGSDGEAFTRTDVTQQSWFYVARLLFVLSAESRGFLWPETATARRSYEVELSLDYLQDKILNATDSPEQARNSHLSTMTIHWTRLDLLFDILNGGYEDLGIEAYGYELFDPDEHPFLNTYALSNPHLAEVVFLLSTTQTDDGYERVDYSLLSPEQVVTLCEGPSEHQLRVALTDLTSSGDESDNRGGRHE